MLRVEGNEVVGEVSIVVAPGTRADVQAKLLDDALRKELADLAASLQVVLVSPPSRYAKPAPGKGADGTTRFVVRGRIEGEQLVPVRKR